MEEYVPAAVPAAPAAVHVLMYVLYQLLLHQLYQLVQLYCTSNFSWLSCILLKSCDASTRNKSVLGIIFHKYVPLYRSYVLPTTDSFSICSRIVSRPPVRQRRK